MLLNIADWLRFKDRTGINNDRWLDDWGLDHDRRVDHKKLILIRLTVGGSSFTLLCIVSILIAVDSKLSITNTNNVSVDGPIKVEHVDNRDSFTLEEIKVDADVIRQALVAEGMVEDRVILSFLYAAAGLPWVQLLARSTSLAALDSREACASLLTECECWPIALKSIALLLRGDTLDNVVIHRDAFCLGTGLEQGSLAQSQQKVGNQSHESWSLFLRLLTAPGTMLLNQTI